MMSAMCGISHGVSFIMISMTGVALSGLVAGRRADRFHRALPCVDAPAPLGLWALIMPGGLISYLGEPNAPGYSAALPHKALKDVMGTKEHKVYGL